MPQQIGCLGELFLDDIYIYNCVCIYIYIFIFILHIYYRENYCSSQEFMIQHITWDAHLVQTWSVVKSHGLNGDPNWQNHLQMGWNDHGIPWDCHVITTHSTKINISIIHDCPVRSTYDIVTYIEINPRNEPCMLAKVPCVYSIYTLWLFNIAMENGPFIDDFPIDTCIRDFPWLC